MDAIRADEISKIIRQQIEGYDTKVEVTEVGTVVQAGDGQILQRLRHRHVGIHARHGGGDGDGRRRQKLGGETPSPIQTIRGRGYAIRSA